MLRAVIFMLRNIKLLLVYNMLYYVCKFLNLFCNTSTALEVELYLLNTYTEYQDNQEYLYKLDES